MDSLWPTHSFSNAAAQLVPLGFYDVPMCVVSLEVVKDKYVLCADMRRSMYLLRWKDRAFELVAKCAPTDGAFFFFFFFFFFTFTHT